MIGSEKTKLQLKTAAQRNAKHYGVDWDNLNKREKTALDLYGIPARWRLGRRALRKCGKLWQLVIKRLLQLKHSIPIGHHQTPERAKDVYSAFTPNLGFERRWSC